MDDLRRYASVARWIDNVNRYYKLPEAEWEGRLAALRVFWIFRASSA